MLTPFLRWLSLKRYQFEITMPLYMMTPTEIFFICMLFLARIDSIIFLLLSLLIIAAVLYLPEHVAIMASRATFYWAGEEAATGVGQTIVESTGASSGRTSGMSFGSESVGLAGLRAGERMDL